MTLSTPILVTREAIKLTGLVKTFTLHNHQPQLLWQEFMPRLKELKGRMDDNLYSVEVYPNDFFNVFDPHKEFQKWTAVRTEPSTKGQQGFEVLHCPAGTYAVFEYQGPASQAPQVYQHIYTEWLPASGYELDNLPHMAVMPAGYRRDDPEAREEIWIPVRTK